MTRAAGGGRKSAGTALTLPPDATTEIQKPKELRDGYAEQMWDTLIPVLRERHQLTVAVGPLLLAYCNSFSRMLEAEAMVMKQGLTVVGGSGGEKKHPALNAVQDAINAMARIGSLLGLDPLSYRRLAGPSGDLPAVGDFAGF